MERVLIWDLPVRVFHWLLAGGFVAAAGIGLGLGEDHPWFPVHAIIGLTLVLMVVLRVIWGVVGTRHARLGGLVHGPRAVGRYLAGVATGRGGGHVGHNPASSWAILAMLGLVVALGVTGVAWGRGLDAAGEVHEALAWVMVAVVAAHVMGVAVHTIRLRDNITRSMIDGRKPAARADAIASARPIAALLGLVLAGLWAGLLLRGYNAAAGTIAAPGLGTIAVGEGPDEGAPGGRSRGRGAEDDEPHERGERD